MPTLWPSGHNPNGRKPWQYLTIFVATGGAGTVVGLDQGLSAGITAAATVLAALAALLPAGTDADEPDADEDSDQPDPDEPDA